MNEVMRKGPIWDLQKLMLKLPQLELPTEHFFANGMYLRHIWVPRGMTIIGRVHKQEHFAICALGHFGISDGIRSFEMFAGDVKVSPPGSKRIGYAIVDSVFITVHRVSQSTDLEAIEDEISEIDPASPFGVGNELKRLK
jgi:hypothetical protein